MQSALDLDSTVVRRANDFLTFLSIAQRRYANQLGHDRPAR